jgi:hypothetical protein
MTSEADTLSREPLDKLLDDLVTAKLEQRHADIERLQLEICKRQACDEQPAKGSAAPAKLPEF